MANITLREKNNLSIAGHAAVSNNEGLLDDAGDDVVVFDGLEIVNRIRKKQRIVKQLSFPEEVMIRHSIRKGMST